MWIRVRIMYNVTVGRSDLITENREKERENEREKERANGTTAVSFL